MITARQFVDVVAQDDKRALLGLCRLWQIEPVYEERRGVVLIDSLATILKLARFARDNMGIVEQGL